MSDPPAVVLAVSEMAHPSAKALFDAVVSLDSEAVSDLLRGALAERPPGVSVLLCSRAAVVLRDDPFGQQRFSCATPVHLASFLGRLEMLRVMIETLERAGPSAPEHDVSRVFGVLCDGETSAAHLAAWGGDNADVLQLVCEAGCDVGQRRASGASVLYIAAARGFTSCIRAALRLGANPWTAHKIGGITPLLIACEHGSAGCVEALLTSDRALAHHADSDGCPPLARVLEMQHDESALAIVRLLVGAGADPTTPALSFRRGPPHGREPESAAPVLGEALPTRVEDADCAIHTAAELGRPACLEALLDGAVRTGASPSSAVDVRGGAMWTPLMMASLRGHDACVRVCLDRGADANARSQDGHTPLMLAARNGHTAIVRQLVRRGASQSACHRRGGTSLFFAAEHGRLGCVRELVRAGSDPFELSAGGTSPVMAALRAGHAGVVKWLTLACGLPLFPPSVVRPATLRRKTRRLSSPAAALFAGAVPPLLSPSPCPEASAGALTVGSRLGLGRLHHSEALSGRMRRHHHSLTAEPLRFTDCLLDSHCRDKVFNCLAAAARSDCSDVLLLAFAPQLAGSTLARGGARAPGPDDDGDFDREPLLSRGGLGILPNMSKTDPHATLLHVASQCGANRAVRVLLSFGANPLAVAAKIRVDCLYTAPAGGVTTLDMVLRASAAMLDKSRRRQAAMCDSVARFDEDESRLVESWLLESRDDAGLAVLHAAAERSGACVARLLIGGANPASASDELRESPLHHAAAYSAAGVTAAVFLMLGLGRSLLFCRNATGETARQVADSVAHGDVQGNRPPVALLLERAEELARAPLTGSGSFDRVHAAARELFRVAKAADERFDIRQLHRLAIKRGRAAAKILDTLPPGQRPPSHVMDARPPRSPRLTQLHAAIAIAECGLADNTLRAIRRAVRAASWTPQRARLVLWRRGITDIPAKTRRSERRWRLDGGADKAAASFVQESMAMLEARHAARGALPRTPDIVNARAAPQAAHASQRALHDQWLAAMRLCHRLRAALKHPPPALTALVRCAFPAALGELHRHHWSSAVPQGPPSLALRAPRGGGGQQSPSRASRGRFPLAMAGAFGRPTLSPRGDQALGQQRD